MYFFRIVPYCPQACPADFFAKQRAADFLWRLPRKIPASFPQTVPSFSSQGAKKGGLKTWVFFNPRRKVKKCVPFGLFYMGTAIRSVLKNFLERALSVPSTDRESNASFTFSIKTRLFFFIAMPKYSSASPVQTILY